MVGRVIGAVLRFYRRMVPRELNTAGGADVGEIGPQDLAVGEDVGRNRAAAHEDHDPARLVAKGDLRRRIRPARDGPDQHRRDGSRWSRQG